MVLCAVMQRSWEGLESKDERPTVSSCPQDVCMTLQLHTHAPSPSLLSAFNNHDFTNISGSALGGYNLLITQL